MTNDRENKRLDQALSHVAVLGAAGKMGSGIALLLLQEMARLELESSGRVGTGAYFLTLIDVNEKAFVQLRSYLRDQLLKFAEKNINSLRNFYAKNKDLVSNEDMIQAYVKGALDLVFFDTGLSSAKNAHLIFEAIIEDAELKTEVFRNIVKSGNKNGFFLSNTSSIPIHVLNENAQLDHRIIGFHFYNPPVVQKLLEIIVSPETNPELVKIAIELAKRLKKIVVFSNDQAGFIGNGHFLREAVFACGKTEELAKEYPLPEAIYMINRVTQEWLIRPMGIFQLMDYVGLDVCRRISEIMRNDLNDSTLQADLLESLVKKGVLGGQNPDGTQRNGFFFYSKHAVKGIYSLPQEKYVLFSEVPWVKAADHALGELPKGHISWKSTQQETDKGEVLKKYFENLYAEETLGARLARDFLENSLLIANKLVQDGVAGSSADVDAVLMNGFYHPYGMDIIDHLPHDGRLTFKEKDE